MKKKIFITILSLIALLFALTITSYAEKNVPEVTHTYYLVQSLDSEAAQGRENVVAIDSLIGKTASDSVSPFFGQFADGSHVEIILLENILVAPPDGSGILINTPITVTIKYNGFIHVIDNGNKYSGFCLRNAGATLRMIGTKAFDLNNGTEYSLTFKTPTGDIGKGTFKLNGCNADAYHYGKVYCWVFAGNTYAENVRSITGQELVFSEASASGTYEFKNCVSDSKQTAVGLEGQSGKTVKIDGGYYDGLTAFSVLTGSYTRNADINNGIYLNCWGITNQIWEFANCKINASLSTETGRTHFKFVDCTFKNDFTFANLGSDNGGSCYALVYTSATCDKAGTLTIYKNGNGNTPVTNDSKYPDSMVEEYVNQNQPQGHNYVQGEVNNNYCPMGFCYDATCSRCDFVGTLNWEDKEAELVTHNHEKIVSIEYRNGYFEIGTITYLCASEGCTSSANGSTSGSLIKWLGYSASNDGAQMCVGYELDQETIAIMSVINPKFEIGVCAAVETTIGSKAPLQMDENGSVIAPKKTIKAKLNDKTVNRIDMIIKGNFLSDHMQTKLLMSAYISNGSTICYAYREQGNATEIATITYAEMSNK